MERVTSFRVNRLTKMLLQHSDLVMAKYIVKLLALVELMLYLNALPLFLKLPGRCFISDGITMFAEFHYLKHINT